MSIDYWIHAKYSFTKAGDLVASLGILGGTFDPIHYGHLIAAEYARYEFKLDKVLVLPAAIPPHKDLRQVLDARYRYRMAELAVKNNPTLEISALEMERNGYSYTVDTVDYYRRRYPGQEIYFITGADSLYYMDTWKDIERLAGLCSFIVVTRPGYNVDREEKDLSDLPTALWDKMKQLQIPGLDISSSDIRRRISEGKPVKYLLPPEVEEYIRAEGLYREGR
ncbi:MAG: nicotinate-nucleotide adenylyltransferase [Syntrophomonas sp.]